MAAEYILKEGNPNVMLCERGIRTFETAYRFTLDITAVPVLKELSHLPVIVDPSHAAGPARPGAAAVAGRGRGGRGRDHRRGAPATPRRRSATARRQLYADGFAEYVEQVERAAAVAGKVLSARAALEGRRRRRRPDRRLDRARRPRAARRRGARLRPGGRRARRARSSAARSTRRCDSVAEAVDGADVGVRRRAGRRAAGRGAARRSAAAGAGLRGHRRRLDQARASWPRSTTRASSAATRWRARRRAGVEHARADLFEGATWYLTPTAAHRGRRSTSACTGCSPTSARGRRRSTPRRTTALMATRLAPAARARQRARRPGGAALLEPRASGCRATGPSFRDATRVAGANTRDLARHLPRQRRRAGRRRSTTPIARLERGARRARRRATSDGDRRAGTTRARDDRRRLLEADLAGGAVHELRVSVPNRPGVVAEIALALGRARRQHRRHGALPAAGQRDGRRSRCGSPATRDAARGRGADRRARASRWRGA